MGCFFCQNARKMVDVRFIFHQRHTNLRSSNARLQCPPRCADRCALKVKTSPVKGTSSLTRLRVSGSTGTPLAFGEPLGRTGFLWGLDAPNRPYSLPYSRFAPSSAVLRPAWAPPASRGTPLRIALNGLTLRHVFASLACLALALHAAGNRGAPRSGGRGFAPMTPPTRWGGSGSPCCARWRSLHKCPPGIMAPPRTAPERGCHRADKPGPHNRARALIQAFAFCSQINGRLCAHNGLWWPARWQAAHMCVSAL
jgi:hypothetical protein